MHCCVQLHRCRVSKPQAWRVLQTVQRQNWTTCAENAVPTSWDIKRRWVFQAAAMGLALSMVDQLCTRSSPPPAEAPLPSLPLSHGRKQPLQRLQEPPRQEQPSQAGIARSQKKSWSISSIWRGSRAFRRAGAFDMAARSEPVNHQAATTQKPAVAAAEDSAVQDAVEGEAAAPVVNKGPLKPAAKRQQKAPAANVIVHAGAATSVEIGEQNAEPKGKQAAKRGDKACQRQNPARRKEKEGTEGGSATLENESGEVGEPFTVRLCFRFQVYQSDTEAARWCSLDVATRRPVRQRKQPQPFWMGAGQTSPGSPDTEEVGSGDEAVDPSFSGGTFKSRNPDNKVSFLCTSS